MGNNGIDEERIVEALIFASPEPLSVIRLAEFLSLKKDNIEGIITHLNQKYEDNGNSFSIREIAGGYQFFVKKDYADIIREFFSLEPRRLSRQAFEVLAVIAMRQPVTRRMIETIRKVNSGGAIKTLLELELIKIVGRARGSRAFLYGTTQKFLSLCGLKSLDELPTTDEVLQLSMETSQSSQNLSGESNAAQQ